MNFDNKAPSRLFPRRDPAGIERLLEGWDTRADGRARTLGATEIDDCLPWGGLPLSALHEIFAGAPGGIGAATGFCAALVARLTGENDGLVLWCESARALDAGGLYAPGLVRFGLAPRRVIAVRARDDDDALWAMEQGLGAGRIAAVVAEIAGISPVQTRRLQLAAETHGATALILRPHDPAAETHGASAAVTRWRIDARAGAGADDGDRPGLGRARWRAEMFRCRGGEPHAWEMEWCDETGGFTVAAALRDGPDRPDASRLAG